MHEEIELNYPEIAKAIQIRRASYFLLAHEYQFVDEMLKKGQLEEKEANQFKNEIDLMIVNLKSHNPEIKLKDQLSSIK
jgi:polyhydroxyalkanoate synthesis regulator phasin